MQCSDFLDLYSDFRDGGLSDPRLRRRVIRHMAECHRCARYHEVIERGVASLRIAEPVRASGSFRLRLRERLTAAIAPPHFGFPVRLVGSFVLAAAVTVLVIEAATRGKREIEPLPPPAQPLPLVQTNPGPPFVTFAELEAPVLERPARVRAVSRYPVLTTMSTESTPR